MSRFALLLKRVNSLPPTILDDIKFGEHFTLRDTGELYYKHFTTGVIIPVAVNNGILQQQYGIFFTDIEVAAPSTAVVNKTYDPSTDSFVLSSATTNATDVTVKATVFSPATTYKPIVYINNYLTITTQISTGIWSAEVTLPVVSPNMTISAIHTNGGNTVTSIEVFSVAAPTVNTTLSQFTGDYPPISPGVFQTELKEGDTVQFSIFSPNIIDQVELIADSSSIAQANIVTILVPSNNVTVPVVIKGLSTTAQLLGLKFKVRDTNGIWSTTYNSATFNGASPIEKTHVVKVNNIKPTVVLNSINYPSSLVPLAQQYALKANESAEIMNTVTNYDSVTYIDLLTQLNITNPLIYETSKIVQARSTTSSLYNVDNLNLRISANRLANNSTTVLNIVVKITSVSPVYTITGLTTRLRSGGNLGTSVPSYLISIESNQVMHPSLAMEIDSSVCTFTDTWIRVNESRSTRNLTVHDDDGKTNYDLSNPTGYNLACVPVSSLSNNTAVQLGGFLKRLLTLTSGVQSIDMGVGVKDSSKLVCTNYSVNDEAGNYTYANDTLNAAKKFTIQNPNTILDSIGSLWVNNDLVNLAATSSYIEVEIEEEV